MQGYLAGRVVVKTGDITAEDTEAIVNAANHSLLGGGGVDGAIHRKGGPQILEECKRIRETQYPEGLPDGQAVATGAGKLQTRFVIHTVGPVWKDGSRGEEESLKNCYLNSLKVASEKKCRTVAIPAISTGIYHFPKERAARIASLAIQEHLEREDLPEQVRLIFFTEADAELFIKSQLFK